MPTCSHIGCEKQPSFGYINDASIFCLTHKSADMINTKEKRCLYEGCDTISTVYDYPNGKGRYCAKHKSIDMIDVRSKICEHSGCNIRASYNLPNLPIRFCTKHKMKGMVCVSLKSCRYLGCNKRPNYDYSGKSGNYCAIHKMDGMIDVKHKRCESVGCKKRPSYNVIGGKGRFCVTHKDNNMICVTINKCIYDVCEKQPAYGYPGKKYQFCVIHKSKDMINIKCKTCETPGCNKYSINFDLPGGRGRFCAVHKTSEMVNVRSTKCKYPDCATRARYGKPGNPKSHCAKHRSPGMIRRPNGKCKRCREPAIYGTNYTPKHCEAHRLPEEQNLVERECVSCHMTMILNATDHCEFCDPATFATARLAKQTALFDYLDARTDLPTPLTTDTIIDGGVCGKERPDRTYDLGDRILILECDEHQHRDRACDCEQTRMANIGQSYGGVPVYFIRWNPDDYSPESDRKEPEPIAKRHKLVGDLIRDIKKQKMDVPTGALVSAIYLYYDGWDKLATEPWYPIVKLEEGVKIEHV